jgi:predicted nucleotidyltransferase
MLQITVDKDKIAAFCQAYHIRQLALYGSVLRPDFRSESDHMLDAANEAVSQEDLPGLITVLAPLHLED